MMSQSCTNSFSSVFVTLPPTSHAVPAGIYAKVHYGKSLSNVDWLHGGADSLLSLSNIFILLGLRTALRQARDGNRNALNLTSEVKQEENR
ncbi:UNVERIFIED_CONTAM: hypothetical protein Slati_3207000 [Sesamum latifolium]|uniref:Uncharacterized protein n=1 Tax=Sesamum latifolium TaxID=2727402 RepID=A0AAW2V319_9LAMI